MEKPDDELITAELSYHDPIAALIEAAGASGSTISCTFNVYPPDVRIRSGSVADGEEEQGGSAPCRGQPFPLGRTVYWTGRCGRRLAGAVVACTLYLDEREPAYMLRPDGKSAEILGHNHDVARDEGEIIGVDG